MLLLRDSKSFAIWINQCVFIINACENIVDAKHFLKVMFYRQYVIEISE